MGSGCVGGGPVVDSQLRGGLHGNAGAVGSFPVGAPHSGQSAPPDQLLSVASIFTLEALYIDHGLAPGAAADARCLAEPWWPHTQQWLARTAPALALAINGATCLLDLDGVIVDGSCGRGLVQAVLQASEQALDLCNWEGVSRPALLAGTIGSDARAIGGALLPLYAHFAPDLFLKLAS